MMIEVLHVKFVLPKARGLLKECGHIKIIKML
jgi:hypothetical protein